MDISVLYQQKIVAIIRHHKPFDVIELFNTIVATGLKVIEITLNTPGAFSLINKANQYFKNNILLGAGTVLTINNVEKSVQAGAKFIVSPVFDPELVTYCKKKYIPIFPGALTPTEIYSAYQAGAEMVKVFPASIVGPKYFKSVKGPLDNVKLIAVGGIRANNVKEYLKNGADAVAIGGGIILSEYIDNGDYDKIKGNINNFIDNM